jgi:putative endonuclease
MRDHVYRVYILASQRNGTLYTGVTNDLTRRVQEHREGLVAGFTRKYRVKLLVWFEVRQDINVAILREKRIKRWHRKWKLELIEAHNPQLRDLWLDSPSSKVVPCRARAVVSCRARAPAREPVPRAKGKSDGAPGPGSRIFCFAKFRDDKVAQIPG